MKLRSIILLAVAGSLTAGCSTGSAVLDSVSSAGDRFSQLFGSNSQPATATPEEEPEQFCPSVAVRDGTATLRSVAQGASNASGVGAVRYQGTIVRTARECVLSDGTTIKAKIGIQGRIIAGLAGAPPTVDIPLRIAVVEEGVQPKVVFSRFYRTSVSMTDLNVPFSFVAEDIAYPAPPFPAGARYVFYVGFDPEGARAQPSRPARKKGR